MLAWYSSKYLGNMNERVKKQQQTAQLTVCEIFKPQRFVETLLI